MLQERCTEALPFFRSAQSVFEAKLPQHFVLGEIKWQLGACLAKQGEVLEARELINAGIATLEEHWGAEHELTQAAYSAQEKLALGNTSTP